MPKYNQCVGTTHIYIYVYLALSLYIYLYVCVRLSNIVVELYVLSVAYMSDDSNNVPT